MDTDIKQVWAASNQLSDKRSKVYQKHATKEVRLMEKYEKCKNCGEDIFFQKRWNKWYHNNGKKNCSKQYPQVQINGLILTPVAQPKEERLSQPTPAGRKGI